MSKGGWCLEHKERYSLEHGCFACGDKFESLDITLKADNSNGKQELHLTAQDDFFFFTLTGRYKGESIQIDFDETPKEQLEDFKLMIEMILQVKPNDH